MHLSSNHRAALGKKIKSSTRGPLLVAANQGILAIHHYCLSPNSKRVGANHLMTAMLTRRASLSLFEPIRITRILTTPDARLSPSECRIMRSLMGRFRISWDRELMTAERMLHLQQKGMVVRNEGRWKLTALGVMYASVVL
jgi:hypothetical protein